MSLGSDVSSRYAFEALSLFVLEHHLVLISQLLESVLLTRFLGWKHGFLRRSRLLLGLNQYHLRLYWRFLDEGRRFF